MYKIRDKVRYLNLKFVRRNLKTLGYILSLEEVNEVYEKHRAKSLDGAADIRCGLEFLFEKDPDRLQRFLGSLCSFIDDHYDVETL